MHNFCYFFSANRSEYRYMQRPWYNFQAPNWFCRDCGGQKNRKSCFPHYLLLKPPAASMEDHRNVNTKDCFLIMTHHLKKVHWLQDCSLKQPQAASRSFKQPPWRLGAMESPIKTSEIIVPNKILIAIYYWVLLDWFLNFSLKRPPWRQGEGGTPSWNLRNDNPVYIKLGDWKILSEW